MAPITVDPDILAGAGESIGSVGDEIATAVGTLTSSLAGGARSGIDPAGLAFGQSYQQTAQALLNAGAAAANAGRSIGFGVQTSATNYSRADASSTIGGGASPLSPPGAPTEFTSPSAPSSLGGGVPPPFLWSVIQAFIPDVWPDGSPGQLRVTADAWKQFSSTMTGIAGHLTGPSGVIAGQQIPEGGAMSSAISELSQSLSGIASEAGKLGTQAAEFADDVEHTQNAIRDLLDRISPSGLWDGIQSIFDGDALDELKEVADDVKTVLGEFGRQAEGRRDMLQLVMGKLDDAIVSVENWARKEFPKYLGDDVGNALATGLDFQLTLGEGVLAGAVDTMNSIGQLDPLRFAYDPEGAQATWAAMGESLGETALYATPTGIVTNPIGAFNHYKDQVTDAVHAEDWSSDRPGYGLGKVVFDVGAALIPGGAALRTTKVAEEALDVASPSPGRIADLPGRVDNFAPIASKADDLTAKLDDLGKFDDNLPASATPNPAGPAVPRDLMEPPEAPKVPDLPGTRVSDAPTPTDALESTQAPTPRGSDSANADLPPVAPHSPTPSGTVMDASAENLTEGVQRSSPLPPTSASPATPIHTPEPTAWASDTPSSAPSGTSTSAELSEASGPSSSEPIGTETRGDSESIASDLGSDADHNHPRTSTDIDQTSDSPDNPWGDDPLSDEKRDEIIAMDKGTRPDPSEYLSPEYIEQHLQKFDDGASRFMPVENLNKYGLAQSDGTSFVMPTSEIDKLMEATKGDPRAMEQALGWPEGYLDKHNVLRIDIPNPDAYNLRVPSGNEAGANELWLPGGKLPGDLSEAVIDGNSVSDGDYTVTDIE